MAETKTTDLTFDQVQQRIVDIIIDHFAGKAGEIKPDNNLKSDLEADSLDVVELAMKVEDEFSIRFPDDMSDFEKAPTIRFLAQMAWDLLQKGDRKEEK